MLAPVRMVEKGEMQKPWLIRLAIRMKSVDVWTRMARQLAYFVGVSVAFAGKCVYHTGRMSIDFEDNFGCVNVLYLSRQNTASCYAGPYYIAQKNQEPIFTKGEKNGK